MHPVLSVILHRFHQNGLECPDYTVLILATHEHVSVTPFCVFIAVFWLKARFHTLQNDMDLAIFYFDKVGHFIYPAVGAQICIVYCSCVYIGQ